MKKHARQSKCRQAQTPGPSRPPCDCKFCPTKNCPFRKADDIVPIAMPKRKLKRKYKLADDDVCKTHQPKYQCGLPKRKMPKCKRPKPSVLNIIRDHDCMCEVVANSVSANVHHHLGLSELRDSINMNAVRSSIDEDPYEDNPE